MTNSVDSRTTADQIIMLERNALDRWGQGDPGGFLELYDADMTMKSRRLQRLPNSWRLYRYRPAASSNFA